MPRECFFLETTVAEYTCRLSQGPNMWPFADKRVYLTTDPACSTIIKSSEADRGTYKKEKEGKKGISSGGQPGRASEAAVTLLALPPLREAV